METLHREGPRGWGGLTITQELTPGGGERNGERTGVNPTAAPKLQSLEAPSPFRHVLCGPASQPGHARSPRPLTPTTGMNCSEVVWGPIDPTFLLFAPLCVIHGRGDMPCPDIFPGAG